MMVGEFNRKVSNLYKTAHGRNLFSVDFNVKSNKIKVIKCYKKAELRNASLGVHKSQIKRLERLAWYTLQR